MLHLNTITNINIIIKAMVLVLVLQKELDRQTPEDPFPPLPCLGQQEIVICDINIHKQMSPSGICIHLAPTSLVQPSDSSAHSLGPSIASQPQPQMCVDLSLSDKYEFSTGPGNTPLPLQFVTGLTISH
mmetsp:Transcript_29364/g.47407  ORF Transcript_29364/g.47407 Transcript_29364/m.47407 type:complete len:129 (+) Transcript_29364:2624-3010(+)